MCENRGKTQTVDSNEHLQEVNRMKPSPPIVKTKALSQRNVIAAHIFVMEEVFPKNIYLKIIIQAPSRAIHTVNITLGKNESKLDENQTGYWRQKVNNHDIPKIKVIDLCRVKNLTKSVFDTTVALFFGHISMLKRSYSMEFDSEYKSEPTQGSGSGRDDETIQISKKICNSNYEERKSPADLDASAENNRSSSHGRAEPYMRFSQSGENAHVTQSRSIFSHEDSFVYGNPKEEIKSIESSPSGDTVGGMSSFENNLTNVLDLSCKTPKTEEEKTDGNTYQTYRRSNPGNEFVRSNLDIKLTKKPSLPEQLQIAKIQQQQRRSMQQQQKLLQQMKRSLDPKANRQDTCHKNVKYTGNNTTNHEQNDLDNFARVKDEFHAPIPGVHFPQFPYPYFDPNHPKELPDNHPILPLLDPVYFSALYNAHGYLPPSSPSIAAAFIGTLQDALPKLPMMFPSTSSNNSSLSPQKGNDNPN